MEGIVDKKHSKWGIASCCTFAFATLLDVVVFLLMLTENKEIFLIEFVIANLAVLLQLFALLLGISGLLEKNHKKTFPIIGTVLSVLGCPSSFFFVGLVGMVTYTGG